MAMTDILQKLRPRRTVLKRTTKKAELPEAALYLEWLGGEMSRKVVDTAKKEHILSDQLLLSNYKIASSAEAEKLIAEHWKTEQPKKQATVRNG